MISRAEKFMELGLGQGWTGKREGLRLGGGLGKMGHISASWEDGWRV